jgi:HEAT repeat protein
MRVDLARAGCYFTSASFLRHLHGEARYMHAIYCLVLLAPVAPGPNYTELRELLHGRDGPGGQSKAALLLVGSHEGEAERLVREGLKRVENEETFLALASAIRMRKDARFTRELVAALRADKPRLRQAAAEALAAVASGAVLRRLESIARDRRAGPRVRQAALWALGRTGKHAAAGVLVSLLEDEALNRVAVASLEEMTGLSYPDAKQWKAWWERKKGLTAEQWLELRLSFQTSRAGRLEGELARARAQVIRLHQQLYSRMPVAERFGYAQQLRQHEGPEVRALSIVFSTELLPSAPAAELAGLSGGILKLTHDPHPDVQRAAVLALGRVYTEEAFGRLKELLTKGKKAARIAATRALAAQAKGTTPETRAQQKRVVPLLQLALEDSSLEVTVEAAEALGALGATEAGPVLTGLLQHSSENVRLTAAQALERVADARLADGLLKGLADKSTNVRFSLVGAVGHALSGPTPASARKALLARLEKVLGDDPDPGVRGRAATVLGECGGAEQLDGLWRSVQSAEGRVQEKAWEAMGEVLVRAGSVSLIQKWDGELMRRKQGERRVKVWSKAYSRWDARPDLRAQATSALEGLVAAYLDEGKWSPAAPLGQLLLTRCAEAGEAARARCLRLMLRLAEQALAAGHKAEALRIVQDAKPYLAGGTVAAGFEEVRKKASGKP